MSNEPKNSMLLTLPVIPPSAIISKYEKWLLQWALIRQLLGIFRKKKKGFFTAIKVGYKIQKTYSNMLGEKPMAKVVKVDKRYFWRLGVPGFPSDASCKMYENEVNRSLSENEYYGQKSVIMAITKRCPLNCEHCFEWFNLSKKESLSIEQWIDIIHKYQKFGTTQIMLSGGEPMLRIKAVHEILKNAYSGTDFWIITSGIGLKEKQAKELKASGLTGILVSLDHYLEEAHDNFRGSKGAYQAVISALVAGKKAGLVTALSLCASKEFTSSENLQNYMQFAKHLGVTFVQILEPRASGRYTQKDVSLSGEQLNALEQISHTYNTKKEFKDYPIINYFGYHQRKTGCLGAGNQFFYIDTEGVAHVCPFCVNKVIDTKNNSAELVVGTLRSSSCHTFEKSTI